MSASAFPIVGIGASAGGLEAFRSFFAHVPADCGMAFVTILHLPADRKSLLPEILARWTMMRVVEAADGTLVEQNCVYVPPPHAMVTLVEGRLRIRMPALEEQKSFRPIDSFFDSLGSSLHEQAIGIVLSGSGSDGALGLKAIKTSGGLTIAQGAGRKGPQYGDMPAGAIATGSVDLIVSVEDIPGHLLRMKATRLAILDRAADSTDEVNASRLKICEILRAQLGHDFSGYRDKTFLRRVQRRMQVVNVATLNEYVDRLQTDPVEVVSLFRDLLIRVTSFFRDQATFETLEASVIPRLFEGKQADGAVRIWVPGCATGEEAYSLAILLREYLDRMPGPPKVQVFATDIDDTAITTARLGFIPRDAADGSFARAARAVFQRGAGRLCRRQVDPRSVHVLDPQFGARSPFFAHGPRFVSKPVDLSRCQTSRRHRAGVSLRSGPTRRTFARGF